MAVTDDILGEISRRISASPLLSDADKSEALDRAREHVTRERKNAAIDDYFAKAVHEFERGHEPVQQLVDLMIDLPTYAPFIRLDNVCYFHGVTYEVTLGVAVTMQDVMARTWEHQSEIEGRKRRGDQLLTPRSTVVGAASMNLPASNVNDLQRFQRV
jgi:hypothetical protein